MAYKSFWSKRIYQIRVEGWNGIVALLRYIKAWGHSIPGIIAVIPLVLIIRIIRPFILFRFGNLNSGRIGMWVFDVEYYLVEKKLGYHPKNIIELFFLQQLLN